MSEYRHEFTPFFHQPFHSRNSIKRTEEEKKMKAFAKTASNSRGFCPNIINLYLNLIKFN